MGADKKTFAVNLPDAVQRTLSQFVEAAKRSFGGSLRSVILFGSAAEGRLRATSDVNLILVLRAFEASAADQVREPLRVAQAAIDLRPMFLLESEANAAAEAFPQKFDDVRRRHRVLYGDNPFGAVAAGREARLYHLKQQLLNLILRLRAAYVARSLREEQLALVIAEAAPPLRSAAAELLELEGEKPESGRRALERVAGADDLLTLVSRARETRKLAPGEAGPAVFRLLELASRMRARSEKLR